MREEKGQGCEDATLISHPFVFCTQCPVGAKFATDDQKSCVW